MSWLLAREVHHTVICILLDEPINTRSITYKDGGRIARSMSGYVQGLEYSEYFFRQMGDITVTTDE